jgi:serine/threonine protein kinase
MSFEFHPEQNVDRLALSPELNIRSLLEKPEQAFERQGYDPEQKAQALKFHDFIISQPELIIGSGNDGVVFDFPSETDEALCLKNMWEELSVEMRFKRFYLLPPKLRELRKIQEYFERSKEKRREKIAKGLNYNPTNAPAAEAGLQVAARRILEEAGFKNAVPTVKSLIRIDAKDSGVIKAAEAGTAEDLPFIYSEIADVIIMDKVNGRSIQDFILNYQDFEDAVARLNPEAFRATLIQMMEALHAYDLTHQDITKRNIMIDFNTISPVIIDFGKSSYGQGSFTKEEEMAHIEEVCRALIALKMNPAMAQANLKRHLKLP